MNQLVSDTSIDFGDDVELMMGFQRFYNHKMSTVGVMTQIIESADEIELSRRTTFFKIKRGTSN